MKKVLLSVRPQWCEKIVSGKKTIEVRKSTPKEVPFKVFIYCTRAKILWRYSSYEGSYENSIGEVVYAQQHIIGEFICDNVDKFNLPYPAYFEEVPQEVKDLIKSACLTMTEAHNYLGRKAGYAWHISDLKIYDKPRKLSEFVISCKTSCERCKNPLYYDCRCEEKGVKAVTRPPQSWQYVEEVER